MNKLAFAPVSPHPITELTAYELAEKVELMRRLQRSVVSPPSAELLANRRRAEQEIDSLVATILRVCPRSVPQISSELAEFMVE